ncbi:MAG: hypothetical protein HZA89_11750 [Verrucomicrobia bacterium]|nr:hypothetical protein [Verrucomicrobiota bacterium]
MIPQLLLAKRLYIEASSYAERADPVSCGIAISMLQDSAELYVWTLIKERNIPVKDQAGFASNIEVLQKNGLAVPNAAKLQELNKARVGFKHYGNLPAPGEALKFQTYVEDFLRLAMQEHFGVKFDELSLVDLVVDQEIQNHLRTAETKIKHICFVEAADELAKAKTLVFARMQKYLPVIDSSLRDTDRILNTIKSVHGINSFAYITMYLGLLREASLVAILRLSLEDYTFLRNSLPSAFQFGSGEWQISRNRIKYTEAECRRALLCIVNLCQRLETAP